MAGSFDFEPSEEDWQQIEAAYPFLTPGDREEISRMATEYLLFAPFESRAPFLSAILRRRDDMAGGIRESCR